MSSVITSKEALLHYIRQAASYGAEVAFTASSGLEAAEVEGFIEEYASNLAEWLDEKFRECDAHKDRVAFEAQAAATRAYYDRLSELAARSTAGGAA